MFKYRHRVPECGKVAFLLTERPQFGDVVRARVVRKLDGVTPVKPTDLVTCESCGRLIDRLLTEWVEE